MRWRLAPKPNSRSSGASPPFPFHITATTPPTPQGGDVTLKQHPGRIPPRALRPSQQPPPQIRQERGEPAGAPS